MRTGGAASKNHSKNAREIGFDIEDGSHGGYELRNTGDVRRSRCMDFAGMVKELLRRAVGKTCAGDLKNACRDVYGCCGGPCAMNRRPGVQSPVTLPLSF